ncbi:MAG: hypothetical protein GY913_25205 [Proteobacteria bacterium]|nr:hypothetical protein [Pseudomonadota bacterium]MCP4920212.1 hypothetical protein [Pseudomonadota bacterium]
MTRTTTWTEHAAAAGVAVLLPAWIVGPAVGGFRVPGVRGELLFSSLAGTPLDAVSPLASSLQLVFSPLGETSAFTLVVFLGLWLAGVGGWALGRPHGRGPAVLGLLALQLAPPVLRGVWTGEISALGVGPAALAIAGVPLAPVFAALACLWCWPLGLLALAARHTCKWTWLAVVPMLVLQWLPSPQPTSWSLRQSEPVVRTVPAYVSTEGAVLPLKVPDPPPPAPVDPLRAVPGGLAALLGLGVGLVFRRRPVVAVVATGAVVLAVLVAGIGWLPPPGAPPGRPAGWWSALAAPGVGRGAAGWAAAVALAGTVGLLELGRKGHAWVAGLVAVLVVAGVERLGPKFPITPLTPDPVLVGLSDVDAPVAVWPAGGAPWFQGFASEAELRFFLDGHQRASVEQEAVWVRWLSEAGDVVVDARHAQDVWAVRESAPGGSWLLFHRAQTDPDTRTRVEGWLAQRAGAPVAESPEWALYSVE